MKSNNIKSKNIRPQDIRSHYEPIGLSFLYDMKVSNIEEIYGLYMKCADEKEKVEFIDKLDQYELNELQKFISKKEKDVCIEELKIINSNPKWAKGLIQYSIFSQQNESVIKKDSCLPKCCLLM